MSVVIAKQDVTTRPKAKFSPKATVFKLMKPTSTPFKGVEIRKSVFLRKASDKVASVQAQHVKVSHDLKDARLQMNAHASKQLAIGRQHSQTSQQMQTMRLSDLIDREIRKMNVTQEVTSNSRSGSSVLGASPAHDPTSTATQSPSEIQPGSHSTAQPAAPSKHLAKWVRTIETFVESGQPTLALTLNDQAKSTVLIKRVGERQVHIHGGNSDQEKLRELLNAKGIILT